MQTYVLIFRSVFGRSIRNANFVFSIGVLSLQDLDTNSLKRENED